MRSRLLRWACLGLCLPGVALAGYRCEFRDGTTRSLGLDLSSRFPGLIATCTVDAVERQEETDHRFVFPRALAAMELVATPRSSNYRAAAGVVDALVETYARRHGVDAGLIRAVIQVESGFRIHARSPKGALGLMQVMPATAVRFGVNSAANLIDPSVNVEVGVRLLRALSDEYGERTDLILAAYNAGEGAVQRFHNQVPPFPETQAYVQKILAHLPTGRKFFVDPGIPE